MKILEPLLETLFPSSCLGCTRAKGKANPDGWACRSCLAGTSIHRWLFCPICNKRLLEDKRCPSHPTTALRALGVSTNYESVLIQKMIAAYKYRFVRDLQEPLAGFLAEYCHATFLPFVPEPRLIIPIPLTRQRVRWRGFNQAEELGQAISGTFSIPLTRNILVREKHTPPQKEIMVRTERFKNVENIFRVATPTTLVGKNVILVDDVATSGATLESAGKVLKKSGAKTVWGLVIARG